MRTCFDTPAKAKRRQLLRREKQARLGLRPLGLLRPVVSCVSKAHNMRLRRGKGFTREELAALKISPKAARSIGIAFDKRRVNRSEESLQRNVQRLQEYMSRLVVFPRLGNKARKGFAGMPDDTLRSQVDRAQLVIGKPMKAIFPVPKPAATTVEFRAPTAEEKNLKAFETIAQARKAAKPKKEKKEGKK